MNVVEVLLVVFLVVAILFLLDQMKDAGEREPRQVSEKVRRKWVEKEEEEEAYVDEELERIRREQGDEEEKGKQ